MPSTYQINFVGPLYRWYPWTGTTWVDNMGATTSTVDSGAIASNNLYTVPYDCFVYYWEPKLTFTGDTQSWQGSLQSGAITGADYASVATSGTSIGRIYRGDPEGSPYTALTYEGTSTFAARGPDFIVRLLKNPSNLNNLGTTIFASAFDMTKTVSGVSKLLETGDYWLSTNNGTNTATYQLSAGDQLAVVIQRNNAACNAGGNMIGLWLNYFMDFSYVLRLARR